MGHAQLPMNMSQSHGETRSGKGYCNDREGFFCTESQSRKIARPSLFRLNSINLTALKLCDRDAKVPKNHINEMGIVMARHQYQI